jgi:hypothetical protein
MGWVSYIAVVLLKPRLAKPLPFPPDTETFSSPHFGSPRRIYSKVTTQKPTYVKVELVTKQSFTLHFDLVYFRSLFMLQTVKHVVQDEVVTALNWGLLPEA